MTAPQYTITGNSASNGSTQIIVPYGVVHFGHDSRAKAIQDWLLLPKHINVFFKNLKKNRDKRSPNTGRWLFQQDGLFAEWLGTSSKPAAPKSLWLHGSVGCGKSVFCSSIVDELPCYLAGLDTSGVAYQDLVLQIFLSYEDKAKYHSLDTVVRALLRQLCFEDSVPEEIERLHRESQHFASTKSLENTLFQILKRMRDSLNAQKASVESKGDNGKSVVRSITIVLDAVDELPLKEKNGLLGLITSLSIFGSSESNFALRLVLTTRPERYMQFLCVGPFWYVNSMQSSKINADIKIFIRERLDKHYKMGQQDPDRKGRIVDLISGRVEGMFRLAELYMDELERLDYYKVPDGEVEQLLEQRRLPETLDKFYDHILKRTEHDDLRSDMFVILKWVLLAARRMNVEELLDACGTLPPGGLMFDERRRRICDEFPDRLSGLIAVSKSPGRDRQGLVTIAHFSVREYLIRIKPMGWPDDALRYDLKHAQAYATKCCVAYLQRFSQISLDPRPFYRYAWRHWSTHAASHYVATTQLGNDIQTATAAPDYHMTIHSSLSLRLSNIVGYPYVYGTSPSDEALVKKTLVTCEMSEGESLTTISQLRVLPHGEVFPVDIGQSQGSPRAPRYEPLPDSVADAIRLIIVHPSSKPNDIISCSQFVDSLDNKPKYYALSYNWKYDDASNIPILVNGRDFPIRSNVACVLKRLRRKSEAVVLWVDVICIRMEDLYERGCQVRLMDKIYSTAEAVIIYLGQDTDPGEACQTDYARDVDKILSPDKHCIACLTSIFDRPLWNRTWILTEFVVARKVVIISDSNYIGWPDIRLLTNDDESAACPGTPECRSNLKPTAGTLSPKQIERMRMYQRLRDDRLRNISDPSRAGLNLPQLLFYSRELEVTQPKDQILTMFILATAAERIEALRWIDYNLSIQEISIAVAKHCLEKQNNLDLLSMNNLRHYNYDIEVKKPDLPPPVYYYRDKCFRDPIILPSWVSAWHCTMWKAPLAPGEFDPIQERIFTAAPPLSDSIEIQDDRALNLEAVRIDTIQSLYRVEDFGHSEFDADAVLDPYSRQLRLVCSHSKGVPCEEPVAGTVLSSGDAEGGYRESQSAFEAFRSKYTTPSKRRHVLMRTILASSPSADNTVISVDEEWWPAGGDIAQYETLADDRSCRMVALGVGGHIGLVPAWAQQDDIIMILKGGAVPYVLRTQPEQEFTYKLVGECYVYGIMNGKAIPADNQWLRVLLV